MKKFAALTLSLLLALLSSGCSALTQEYDASSYIASVLTNNYTNDSTSYITHSGATADEALENYNATMTSGLNRFCTYFGLSLTAEEQVLAEALIEKAYSAIRYSVLDETATSSGYVVRVEVEPMTVFSDLAPEIFRYKRELADSVAAGTAATSNVSELESLFATHVLTVCSEALDTPAYGESITVIFDIIKDASGNLSIDMLDFDRVDEAAILYD